MAYRHLGSYILAICLATTGSGLGIEVNEAYVRDRAAEARRWRNPVWRHKEGNFAEWLSSPSDEKTTRRMHVDTNFQLPGDLMNKRTVNE